MWTVGGYYLTSVSLTVAARKILRGEIREPGVILSEKAFEKPVQIEELKKALPGCLIVHAEAFCLGSGWILLLLGISLPSWA